MAVITDYSDITIERIPREECPYWCEKGRVSHRVLFDIRANGERVEVARGCSECMQKYSENLKLSLPSPEVK